MKGQGSRSNPLPRAKLGLVSTAALKPAPVKNLRRPIVAGAVVGFSSLLPLGELLTRRLSSIIAASFAIDQVKAPRE